MEALGRRQRLLGGAGGAARGALGAAALGVGAMVAHTELLAGGRCQWQGCIFLLELLMAASTAALLLLLLRYHCLRLQLAMLDAGARDWRAAVPPRRALWVLLELGLCALHPGVRGLPGGPCPPPPGPWRRALALAMLGRLALAPRALLGVPGGAAAGSLGALGAVAVGGPFALRALLWRHPSRVLLGAAGGAWLLGAWVLAACEREAPEGPWDLAAGLWLVPVTFLTVGYGDTVPRTACGRLVCLATGIMGVCCTALLVAVAARHLEFTRAERVLHGLVMGARSQKKVRALAAGVLQAAWRLHRAPPRTPGRWRLERRLLAAIEGFRKARRQHRRLQEEAEPAVTLDKVLAAVAAVAEGQRQAQARLRRLEQGLEGLRGALGGGHRAPTPPGTPPGPPRAQGNGGGGAPGRAPRGGRGQRDAPPPVPTVSGGGSLSPPPK